MKIKVDHRAFSGAYASESNHKQQSNDRFVL